MQPVAFFRQKLYISVWMFCQGVNTALADGSYNERQANMVRTILDPDYGVADGAQMEYVQEDCSGILTATSSLKCPNNSHDGSKSGYRNTNSPHEPYINTMDAYCRLFEFSVSFVMVGITCMFGFLGNILSIMTLRRDSVRSVTTYLLSALAVADIAFLIPAVFVIMIPTYCEFYQHCADGFISLIPYLEQYGWALASTCHTCTVYVTVLVALHRYFCVCRIDLARRLSGLRRVKIQTCVVPVVALLYNSPRFFEYKIIHYAWNDTSTAKHVIRHETTKILATVGRNHIFQIGYKNLLFFIVMYLIPLAILITVSINLIKKLEQRRHISATLRSMSRRTAAQRRRDDSITLVLIIIIATFIVCQTPTMIQRLILTVSGSEYIGCGYFYFYFEHIADYMALLNSSTNFVIYIVFSGHFRRTLIADVLCRRTTLKQTTPVVSLGKVNRDTGGERNIRSMGQLRGPHTEEMRSDRQMENNRNSHRRHDSKLSENKWLLSPNIADFKASPSLPSGSRVTSQELLPTSEEQSAASPVTRRTDSFGIFEAHGFDTDDHSADKDGVVHPQSDRYLNNVNQSCDEVIDNNTGKKHVFLPLIALEPASVATECE